MTDTKPLITTHLSPSLDKELRRARQGAAGLSNEAKALADITIQFSIEWEPISASPESPHDLIWYAKCSNERVGEIVDLISKISGVEGAYLSPNPRPPNEF